MPVTADIAALHFDSLALAQYERRGQRPEVPAAESSQGRRGYRSDMLRLSGHRRRAHLPLLGIS